MSSEEPANAPASQLSLQEIANERKVHGNDCYRSRKWNEALVAYQSALNHLPKRHDKQAESGSSSGGKDGNDEENEDPNRMGKGKATEGNDQEEETPIEISSPVVSEAEKQTASLRAMLNANIGACYVKLGDHKEAVKYCTEAILDDPTYIKARERRAASNDILNTWTSLTAIQEDYNALLKLVPSTTYQADIKRKLDRLQPRIETAQKKETDEMLDKLKGLGNSNFGLSTENFKFVPNGSGGYSVNFTR
ncbi:hypothetical protein CPB84DRAFT_1811859 [Gymnopilus junonius]|uniref:Tetratricopeptide repeat protein 1 n=1 Tax=Gymnopilus junonius TaxID=109634 RepID=A0A9P5TTK8_GYMJU|nr:hypothetical protein CPB84DRAFT_1811859 [Gymnopilus junonius]